MPPATKRNSAKAQRERSLDVEPRRRLDYEPVIDGYDDIDAALEELAYLKSRRETREKAVQNEIERLKSEAAKDLTVKIGRHEMPIAEREADLREIVETYCRTNREPLLVEWGGKSRKFTHGSVQFREAPEGLKFLEGENEASVLSKIEKRAEETKGILGRLWDVLKTWHLFRAVSAATFVEIKLSLAKSKIYNAAKQREIEPEELAALGLAVGRNQDSFSITLNEYLVQREVQE